MFNKNKNNKGFTLVEILVVIAIIGILAVVAVPSLFKNIEKAKIAELEADISTLRSAALSYYADTSGNLPYDSGIMLTKEDGKVKVNLDWVTDSDGNKNEIIEAVESFMKEIEGLSMPFGDTYWIRIVGGEGTVDYSIELIVINHNISDSGLEKLENNIGKERIKYPYENDLQISLVNKL